MFKELLVVCALLTPHTVEPLRAIINANTYTIVNASSANISLYQDYSGEAVTFAAKTIRNYPYQVQTDDGFFLNVSKNDYPSVPLDFYYIYNAPDYDEPVAITFNEVDSSTWGAFISGYGPSTGLQVGRFESLNGIHAYIDESKFGINGNLNASLPYNTLTDLIPFGVTFKYVLKDGVISQTVNHMFALKYKPSVGSINGCVLYADYGQTSIIASNGYDPNLNPFLLYYEPFTNQVIFQDGYKTVKFGELYGSLPYYFTDVPIGYIGDDDDARNEVWDSLTKSFELVGMVFSAIGTPFAWVILPGVSIGVLLLVPLLIGMFVWLIRFLKKG